LLFRPSEEIPVTLGTAVVKTVGEAGVYGRPGFSPNGSHILVTRNDPQTGNLDIWTFDVATGKGYAVTNDVWPDFFKADAPPPGPVVKVSQNGALGFT
jgi:Tol biopolymer transport system component